MKNFIHLHSVFINLVSLMYDINFRIQKYDLSSNISRVKFENFKSRSNNRFRKMFQNRDWHVVTMLTNIANIKLYVRGVKSAILTVILFPEKVHFGGDFIGWRI